jgi:hypothetical protein
MLKPSWDASKWQQIRNVKNNHWILITVCEANLCALFVGLAYQGKDIAFIFIIEHSSLRDFGP